jgi:hypothetical protein
MWQTWCKEPSTFALSSAPSALSTIFLAQDAEKLYVSHYTVTVQFPVCKLVLLDCLTMMMKVLLSYQMSGATCSVTHYVPTEVKEQML